MTSVGVLFVVICSVLLCCIPFDSFVDRHGHMCASRRVLILGAKCSSHSLECSANSEHLGLPVGLVVKC